MNEIRIYIDNTLIDLPVDNLNLNLTYSLKDREGFAINTGSRSEYSFELPATNTNNSIFKRFFDVSEETATKQVLLSARIEVNGLPFFSGLAQLTSVTTDADVYYWKSNTYKVSFYGNNVDWVATLKNKFLYQYDYGTHTFDYGDILTAINNDYFNNYAYKYILLKWKDWNVSGQVDLLEFTPALFIKTIVDKIFSDIGYTIQSNFFSLDSFQKFIMPIPLGVKIADPNFGIDYMNIEANSPLLNLTTAFYFPLQIDNQSIAPLIGSNPFNIATYQYTAQYNGYYLCKISVDATNVTFGGYILYFTLNGVAATLGVPVYANGSYNYEQVIFANVGDIIEVRADQNPISLIATADVIVKINITGEATVSAGLTIDFKYFINKSWNSLNFIKGLAHAFNLTFQTDVDNKTIYIEPANTYLNQSRNPNLTNTENGFYNGTINDLTQDVDLLKGGEVYNRSDINQLVKFTWQYDGADPTLEAINGTEDIALHQARFIFIPNRFQKDEDIIENPFFSTTLSIYDSQIQDATSSKTPLIPIIWNQNYLENTISIEANYDIMPRILGSEIPQDSYNGLINCVIDNLGTLSAVPCPIAYMVDYNNTTGDFISLSFGSETVNGYNIKGLLSRFYLADFVRKQSGKEVECFIFWDTLMIQRLDFRSPIKIHGDNYILQEINSFSVTSNESTRTFLIYDDLGNGTEETQITNSLIIGKLNV